jgi:hypothetical protein
MVTYPVNTCVEQPVAVVAVDEWALGSSCSACNIGEVPAPAAIGAKWDLWGGRASDRDAVCHTLSPCCSTLHSLPLQAGTQVPTGPNNDESGREQPLN